MTKSPARAVAVIGAGISGLTAAYLLQNRGREVTLYEAEPRLGGHAHTHDVTDRGRQLAVDSGFIVHNRRTYPLLCRLFDELGVATRESEMSMSVSCEGCGLEYCGARGAGGLFARPANAARARYLGLLAQVPLFHKHARALLSRPDDDRTLGTFLADHHFGRYFTRHFVIPLVSAVWSCGPRRVTEYPARYLFTFLENHGMLSVKGSHAWRTVVGGSRSYTEQLEKHLRDVRLLTPVRAVTRHADAVAVHDDSDAVRYFDEVVVACHADQAIALLTDANPLEETVLKAFEYSHNDTVLHTDASLLPRRERARGSWNYRLSTCAPPVGSARVSYSMNRLQGLDSDSEFVVTLGGSVAAEHVLASMRYRHPVFTHSAVAAQRRLGELNTGRTAFAGAYHGWGFHEDGCRAGVAAAESLGASW